MPVCISLQTFWTTLVFSVFWTDWPWLTGNWRSRSWIRLMRSVWTQSRAVCFLVCYFWMCNNIAYYIVLWMRSHMMIGKRLDAYSKAFIEHGKQVLIAADLLLAFQVQTCRLLLEHIFNKVLEKMSTWILVYILPRGPTNLIL